MEEETIKQPEREEPDEEIIKYKIEPDGTKRLVFDSDALEKKMERGSFIELIDSVQGIQVKMISDKINITDLADLSASAFNFIKSTRTQKEVGSYY